jgi:PRC-barrel domain
MVKTLAMVTALSGLMLSTALAQSTPPAPEAKPAPSAAMPGDAKAQVVTAQKPDQWLASKFRGTDVVGPENEKIGNVSDILFERNGSVVAYIVGVGGFLGIGAKDVALAPSSFQIVRGENGAADQLKVTLTKDQLKQMASFEPYAPPTRTSTDRMSPRPGGTTGTAPRPAQ